MDGAAKAAGAAAARMRSVRSTRRSLPDLDDELRLEPGRLVADLELDVLGADALLHPQRRAALVVARMGALSDEERGDLVVAGLHVAEPEPLHAAALQRLLLALGVEVV